MFQILDAATLMRLLDGAPAAVRCTIENGEWAGCLWPGHPEWEIHEACIQIRSLALHYFMQRYPAATAHHHDITSQLLASQVCPQGGTAHLEASALVDQALLWLWALGGGPAAPQSYPEGSLPPLDPPGQIRLPGGNPGAFTATALAMWEALLYTGVTAAQQVANAFLRGQTDLLTQRALRLVDMLTRPGTQEWVDIGIACVDCGTQDLELWYTGQKWGETLCVPCYEARVTRGQARPQEL